MSYNALFKDANDNNYLMLANVNSFIVYSQEMVFSANVWYAIANLGLTDTNSSAVFDTPVDIRGTYSSGTLHLRSTSNITVRVSVIKLI
jgi:hypothetical protein